MTPGSTIPGWAIGHRWDHKQGTPLQDKRGASQAPRLFAHHMTTAAPPYFSFLLRLWLAGDDDRPEWRLVLVAPLTGETHGFASLEALTAFLQARMDEANPPEAENPET
jgi:hypothetical protein